MNEPIVIQQKEPALKGQKWLIERDKLSPVRWQEFFEFPSSPHELVGAIASRAAFTPAVAVALYSLAIPDLWQFWGLCLLICAHVLILFCVWVSSLNLPNRLLWLGILGFGAAIALSLVW